jgi:arylsulfatase A-like enzyme
MDVHGPYFSRPEFYAPFFKDVKKMPDKRLLTMEEKRKLGYLASGQAAPIIRENMELAQYYEFWPAFYDAGIREMDFHIQELKNALKKMKLWNNSYIIITGDHGEELLEHGYWNHGATLYETELHVPLIMKCPGLLPSRKRISQTARLIDLMPTLAEQLNMPLPQQIQGVSLNNLISSKQSTEAPAFSEGVKGSPLERSLSIGKWKLIVKPNRDTQELYNIADDPQEQKNLYTQNLSVAQKLTKLLDDQVAENTKLSKQTKLERVTTTPQDYERLKSLGYIE